MRFGDHDGLGTIYNREGKLLLGDEEEFWMAVIPNGWFDVRLPLKQMKHRRVYVACSMGLRESLNPRKELSNIDKSLVLILDSEHQAIDKAFDNGFASPILITNRRIVKLRSAVPSRQLLLGGGYMPGIGAEWYSYERDIWDSRRRIYGEIYWKEILRIIVADYGAVLVIKPGTHIFASYEWRYGKRLDTLIGPDSWVELGVRYPKQLFQLKTFLRIARMLGIPISFSGTGSKRWHQFHSMFHFEDSPVEAGLLTSRGEPILMSGERMLRSFRAMCFVYWPRKAGGSLWRRHEFLPPDWCDVFETTQRIILTRKRSKKDARYRAFEDGRLYLCFEKRVTKVRRKTGEIRLKLSLDKRNKVIARLVREPTPNDMKKHERGQRRLELWYDKVFKKYRQPVGATEDFSKIPFDDFAYLGFK